MHTTIKSPRGASCRLTNRIIHGLHRGSSGLNGWFPCLDPECGPWFGVSLWLFQFYAGHVICSCHRFLAAIMQVSTIVYILLRGFQP